MTGRFAVRPVYRARTGTKRAGPMRRVRTVEEAHRIAQAMQERPFLAETSPRRIELLVKAEGERAFSVFAAWERGLGGVWSSVRLK